MHYHLEHNILEIFIFLFMVLFYSPLAVWTFCTILLYLNIVYSLPQKLPNDVSVM